MLLVSGYRLVLPKRSMRVIQQNSNVFLAVNSVVNNWIKKPKVVTYLIIMLINVNLISIVFLSSILLEIHSSHVMQLKKSNFTSKSLKKMLWFRLVSVTINLLLMIRKKKDRNTLKISNNTMTAENIWVIMKKQPLLILLLQLSVQTNIFLLKVLIVLFTAIEMCYMKNSFKFQHFSVRMNKATKKNATMHSP